MADNHYLIAGAWGSKGNAIGLKSYRYDCEAQRLSLIGTFEEYQSMSVVVADGDLLFSCVESKKDDLILSFRVMPDGSLQRLDVLHTGAVSIADIGIDRANRFLFVCGFMTANVCLLSYDADGKLTLNDTFHVADPGSFVSGSSRLERQNASHPHCARLMPDGKHVALCDMGNDRIYILAVDAEQKKLTLCPDKTFVNDPEEGARYITIRPDGKIAYMNTEMGNTVYTLAIRDDGSFERLQKLQTLLPGVENPEKGWCSVNVLSPDGKYLYVGNRGQNNIAVFAVGSDGTLSLSGHYDCGGVSPRGLCFGFGGDTMLTSCNSSGTISVLGIDKASGAVGPLLQQIEGIPGSAGVVWG